MTTDKDTERQLDDVVGYAVRAGFDAKVHWEPPPTVRTVSVEGVDCTDEVAALVRIVAAECAKVCDEVYRAGRLHGAQDSAAAIRAKFGVQA